MESGVMREQDDRKFFYASREIVLTLAEKLHQETRTERIYEILACALEEAELAGWKAGRSD